MVADPDTQAVNDADDTDDMDYELVVRLLRRLRDVPDGATVRIDIRMMTHMLRIPAYDAFTELVEIFTAGKR